MKKKLQFSFIAIGLSTAMVVVTAASQSFLFTKAKDIDYSLIFDVNKNNLTTKTSFVSGTAYPKTENNNTVMFTYSNLMVGDEYSWQVLSGNNSCFYNSWPINGLKSVSISFERTYSQTFKIYWSNTSEFDNEHSQEYTSQSTPTIHTFEDDPIYVKIENTSGNELNIANVTYTYSCTKKYSNITVTSEDYSKGYVTGGGACVIGNTTTINAIPQPGYLFTGWYVNEVLVSKESSYSFTVPETDTTFIAKFVKNDDWDDKHGVNPVLSSDEKTLTYGLYPQTIVSNPEQGLIEAGKNYSDEYYFGYKDEYYVRDTGNPYANNYTFSDGTKVESGKPYYFKCEPVKWNVVESVKASVTIYTLDCSNIIYSQAFNKKTSSICNLYSSSNIRTWLNNGTNSFYEKAFKFNSSHVFPVTLQDVSVENEKVWVGSTTQYSSTWYPSTSDAIKKVSDFALCNYTYSSLGNGEYWTRTPDLNSIYKDYIVSTLGYTTNTSQVDNAMTGVSPCIKLKM